MKLLFLGTRGYIDVRSPRHRMHSALLVLHRGRRVMVDCGEDWLGRLDDLCPSAVVVTHAHPDHAWGLRRGVACPVHATAAGWSGMQRFAIPSRRRRVIAPRSPVVIAGVMFEAFPVKHSLRAPAVGYRIGVDGLAIFYVPDVLSVPMRSEALSGLRLYVGDGASLVRSIVRGTRGERVGHASVRTQLDWCTTAGVPRAIFTHCGTQIVRGQEWEMARTLRAMGRERGIEASLAYDGLSIVLRDTRTPSSRDVRSPGKSSA
jgi:phosphoribosyl 1,2-cyclic phosphodiesterase